MPWKRGFTVSDRLGDSNIEERMEYRMRLVQLHPRRPSDHPPNLLGEVVPMFAAEVVEDDEAALFQVVLNACQLGFVHLPEARFRHVGDRVGVQLSIIERKNVAAIQMRLDEGNLLQIREKLRSALG